VYAYLEKKIKKKVGPEKEKRIRRNKGVKGIRDTLREIDEKISKNKSTD
jgi:hypothetical protein